jgi:hypothetical protein
MLPGPGKLGLNIFLRLLSDDIIVQLAWADVAVGFGGLLPQHGQKCLDVAGVYILWAQSWANCKGVELFKYLFERN